MSDGDSYFFCGVGGSGMMPLALILKASGAKVEGSDRSYDSGRTTDKFAFLSAHGVKLYPQDGSGVVSAAQTIVVSAAIEETVADVQAARRVEAPIITRAQLLAQLFNAAPLSIAIGGTSGKSTTTGMIGWILDATGRAPTVMNGAVMKNFVSNEAPFASSKVGAGQVFVSEVDESDGSIALYRPHVAVLNNVAVDHKPMAELRTLFRDFIATARVGVLNLDNAEAAAIGRALGPGHEIATYSLHDSSADLVADNIEALRDGIAFRVRRAKTGAEASLRLQIPGRHNVENALAALSAALAAGVPLDEAAKALESFAGLRRRFELVGAAHGVTVIDDFAHNPDKIAATLATLHAFDGRVIVMFQPHGFGPLRLMRDELVESFARNLRTDDVLLMPEPVYFGGTVERTVSSQDIAELVRAKGRTAIAVADRDACRGELLKLAKPGDRIVIMGARDDTLSTFAEDLVAVLRAKAT